jgi:DNA invertase Pin-like site-specific DNA recombinase
MLPGQMKLTREQVAEMLEKRSQGATYAELMDEYGVSRQTIANYIKREEAPRDLRAATLGSG